MYYGSKQPNCSEIFANSYSQPITITVRNYFEGEEFCGINIVDIEQPLFHCRDFTLQIGKKNEICNCVEGEEPVDGSDTECQCLGDYEIEESNISCKKKSYRDSSETTSHNSSFRVLEWFWFALLIIL